MDVITQLKEREQLSVIYVALAEFPVSNALELIAYGDWGIEFKSTHPLMEQEVQELATKLSGNVYWPDLSWASPVTGTIRLKVCGG